MLSVNISEVFWTLVNFFLLMFLLKRFLFDPIVTFMDKRNERIQSALTKEKDAEEAVRLSSEQNEARVAACRSEAKDRIAEHKTSNERKHAELLGRLKRESTETRRSNADLVKSESAEVRNRLAQEEASLAEGLAEALLNPAENVAPLQKANVGMPIPTRN